VPELPEVETIVRELRPGLVGRTLRNPKLYRRDVLRGVSPRRILAALDKAVIRDVSRRAKHVVIRIGDDHRVVIQLRMTGALLLYDRRLTVAERKYAVLQATVSGGSYLVFRDVRRLGTVTLLDSAGWRVYTERIGPEPLSAQFRSSDFENCMRRTRQAIKKALMDQRLIAGVGNIYANEALFRAELDPSRPANALSAADYKRLYRNVRSVLRAAIGHGGTTVRDYRTSTGARGNYQDVLQVYGRGGEPCVRCRTRLTTTHSIDGRATTFCFRCQGAGK
jgi:formamidopyrimidine-DNA glycosylase